MKFNHSEADTIMLSIYCSLCDLGYHGLIVLDVADTDAYVAAANISHQYPTDLLIKTGAGFLNCKTLVDYSMIDCIIPFHTMTGCDATSGFYGKGKAKLFDKVRKSDRAKEQLEHLGEDKILA